MDSSSSPSVSSSPSSSSPSSSPSLSPSSSPSLSSASVSASSSSSSSSNASSSTPLFTASTKSQKNNNKKDKRAQKRAKQKAVKKQLKEIESKWRQPSSSSSSSSSTSTSSSSSSDNEMKDIDIKKAIKEKNNNKSKDKEDDEEEKKDKIIYTLPEEFQQVPEVFQAIFAKFTKPEELTQVKEKREEQKEDEEKTIQEEKKQEMDNAEKLKQKEREALAELQQGKKLSHKERKMKNRLTVAELKQLVERPDVVESHDSNSSDPKLLVWLKAYRNTVTVPAHWSQKRKYLQGKRGFEKPAFDLPQFIKDTGIMKLRGAMEEKDKNRSNRQKAKDRMAPKMGRLDIDYQVLHDAFFRYQTKPSMTNHGQMYYEGKEFEYKVKEKRPGVLSEELRTALGIEEKHPPPWLRAMQRWGPPPSYPNLKIPGVNAPIPEGATWGFGEGEWGQPPVDTWGRPIYGDVYGTEKRGDDDENRVDKAPWGMLREEAEEEGEAEEEEEEAEEEDDDGEEEEAVEGEEDGCVDCTCACACACG
eukprot:TRINITY_DN251_c0_g1_i1.p1 TRINITY_DN251_c0_g1~~TRINITY_DN251_c0_g1_i1.p1  ORF type:complete len:549 (-),score=249.12 TRINITY_DN251_c0_g1_i1:1129-2718(-)